jgi:hypothetical protein
MREMVGQAPEKRGLNPEFLPPDLRLRQRKSSKLPGFSCTLGHDFQLRNSLSRPVPVCRSSGSEVPIVNIPTTKTIMNDVIAQPIVLLTKRIKEFSFIFAALFRFANGLGESHATWAYRSFAGPI